MSISCQYDQLKYSTFLGDSSWQFTVETKLSLPENLPKIGTVIGGDFQTGPVEFTVNDDFITVSGKIHPQILFIAEFPEERKKRRLQDQEQEVDHDEEVEEVALPQEYGASWPGEAGVNYEERIEAPGIRTDMLVQLEVKPLRGVFEKVGVDEIAFRGSIQINVHPAFHQSAGVVTDIKAQAQKTVNLVKDRLVVEELLETKKIILPIHSNLLLSNLKPGAARILKVMAVPNGITYEMSLDRLFIKGMLDVELVYVGSDDDGNPTEIFAQMWSHETSSAIPFETHIDLAEANGGEILAVPRVTARDILVEIQTPHELHCLMNLDIEVNLSGIYQKEMIVDAIPEEGELIDSQKYLLNLEEYSGETSGEVDLEQQIELPNGFAGMERILACAGMPGELTAEAADGKALIEGGLSLQVVYLSEDGFKQKLHVAGWDKSTENELSVAGILEFPGLQPGTLLRVYATIESMKVEIIDGHRLKLTGVVKFRVIARTPRAVFVIQDCAMVSPVEDAARPSMLFYVVQTEDTLWKIARRYQTTMDTLLKANQITSPESIVAGQKLFIPKKIV